MNDNISRQDAIERVLSITQIRGTVPVDTVLWELKKLPSTDRTGHEEGFWLLDPDGMDWNLPAWVCSECHRKNDNIGVVEKGHGRDPRSWAGSKFCPNCGARMSGEPKVWKKEYI